MPSCESIISLYSSDFKPLIIARWWVSNFMVLYTDISGQCSSSLPKSPRRQRCGIFRNWWTNHNLGTQC
jgi:hypothetical protein